MVTESILCRINITKVLLENERAKNKARIIEMQQQTCLILVK